MARTPLLAALSLLLLACGEDGPAPGPVPGAGAAAVLPAAEAAVDGVPAEEAAPRPPLPKRPADEAERLRGLLRLLEWGDASLVEFAQERIAAFPDRAAAAAALAAAGEANFVRNPALVHNILGCVKDADTGRLLVPFFLRCLEVGDPQVRRMAVLQYAQSVAEPDCALLGRLVLDDWYPVSQAALEGLRHHPGPAAAAALRAVVPATREFQRAAALSTLGFLGDPESVPLLRAELAAAAAAGRDAWTVYVGAAQGLGRLGDAEGLAALREIVRTLPLLRAPVPLDAPEESWDGPEVVLALAGDADLRKRLVRQATDPDLRGAAASAVRLLREYPVGPETLGAFLAAVECPEWEPLLEGLAALRAAGSPDALPRTLAALAAPETDRRYAAALALGRFKDPATVKPLLERFAVEKDPSVARKICDALGILGDPAAAGALTAWLASDPAPSPEMALQAFEARGNLTGALGEAAAGDLVRLVSSEKTSAAVRFHAARALGGLAPTAASRAALAALLLSGDPDLRAAAADALGQTGDRAARDDLAQAYAREPDEVVAAAIRDDLLRIDLGTPVEGSPR